MNETPSPLSLHQTLITLNIRPSEVTAFISIIEHYHLMVEQQRFRSEYRKTILHNLQSFEENCQAFLNARLSEELQTDILLPLHCTARDIILLGIAIDLYSHLAWRGLTPSTPNPIEILERTAAFYTRNVLADN